MNKEYYLEIARKMITEDLSKYEGWEYNSNGATKDVYVNKNDDWVIKTNISECPNDADIDYCRTEYENYLMIKGLGLESYFTPIIPIGFIMNEGERKGVYIQKKCATNEEAIVDSLALSLLEENDTLSPEEAEDEVCMLEINEILNFLYPDDKEIYKIINFCWDHDINDLHEGNFGYLDDKLVILDYSGY